MFSIVFLLSTLFLHYTLALDISQNTSLKNLTNFLQQREKRHLIFSQRGAVSINIGPAINVDLGDSVPWRSLVYIFNLHVGQYLLPTDPIYPWDKWEENIARNIKKTTQILDDNYQDYARLFIYKVLENYINTQVKPIHDTSNNTESFGYHCVLRAICENAQIEHHEGIYAEIINIVLTPPQKSSENLDFLSAYIAGKSGADCLSLYCKCHQAIGLLNNYFIEF